MFKTTGKHYARTATVSGCDIPGLDGELPVVAIGSVDFKAFNYDSRRCAVVPPKRPCAVEWLKSMQIGSRVLIFAAQLTAE
jgi:hypothetical protein